MTATPALTSNDPRDLDGKRLQNAMQTLGRDPALRARLIARLPVAAGDCRRKKRPPVDGLLPGRRWLRRPGCRSPRG